MKFIKLQALSYREFDNNILNYSKSNSIIINSSHIIDIFKSHDYTAINPAKATEFSAMFDVPISKLCVFKITLTENRSWFVVAPEKKFDEFKN